MVIPVKRLRREIMRKPIHQAPIHGKCNGEDFVGYGVWSCVGVCGVWVEG